MIIHLIVGFMGVALTWIVLKRNDWGSKPYSSYRHTQFVFAAIGAVGWSYCLLGITKASLDISLPLGLLIVFSLSVYLHYGGKRVAVWMCKAVGIIKGYG